VDSSTETTWPVWHSSIVTRRALVAFACLCGAAIGAAEAGDLKAQVKDQKGAPVEDAVVVAIPRAASGPPRPTRETIDQVDKEFVPYVKALPVGSSISFPNKDNIRHHVYSFSPAKTFELPLYVGTPANPVVFDRPGVVAIGCNIHDWMIAHIYVSESPYLGTTGKQGTLTLENLPAGTYTVRVWHPRMEGTEEATSRQLTVERAGAVDATWQLTVRPDLRPRRAPVAGARGYR
jgi:plastocyanin